MMWTKLTRAAFADGLTTVATIAGEQSAHAAVTAIADNTGRAANTPIPLVAVTPTTSKQPGITAIPDCNTFADLGAVADQESSIWAGNVLRTGQ